MKKKIYPLIFIPGSRVGQGKSISVNSGGPRPPSLFVAETEARRVEKNFFWRPGAPRYLRVWVKTRDKS